MRKIKKILLIFSIIITLSMAIMPIISSATISINSAELYSKGRAENLIKYKNSSIICTIVVYSKDGKEYPAYCLNSDLPGVGELSNMLVSTKELISNVIGLITLDIPSIKNILKILLLNHLNI